MRTHKLEVLMEFTIGQQVELNKPYKGWRYAEIIGYEFPYYKIKLTTGLELNVYRDEIQISI